MDVRYVGAMILRGIGQADLPIEEIKQIKKDNSLFSVETKDRSRFLIKIEKNDFEMDSIIFEQDEDKRIHSIFESFTQSRELNELLMRNEFDNDWLKEKLEHKDYRRLENDIMCYASKNDEILFAMGFKYAWSLFSECIEKG